MNLRRRVQGYGKTPVTQLRFSNRANFIQHQAYLPASHSNNQNVIEGECDAEKDGLARPARPRACRRNDSMAGRDTARCLGVPSLAGTTHWINCSAVVHPRLVAEQSLEAPRRGSLFSSLPRQAVFD